MPKKKKPRSSAIDEEFDRAEKEDLLRRIDDAQANLLKMQMELGELDTKLQKLSELCGIYRTDRDAAIHMLKVVLTDQRLKEHPNVNWR